MKKSKFYVILISLLCWTTTCPTSGLTYTQQEFSLHSKAYRLRNAWLQLRRGKIHFSNGINVEFLIVHSKIPGRTVASISPDEKYIIVGENHDFGKADPWTSDTNYDDYYLCELNGKRLRMLQAIAERGIPGFWSRSSRYVIVESLFYTNGKKLLDRIDRNDAMKYYMWSINGDYLLYSDDKSFRNFFVAKIQNGKIIRYRAPQAEIAELIGAAYPAALEAADELSKSLFSYYSISKGDVHISSQDKTFREAVVVKTQNGIPIRNRATERELVNLLGKDYMTTFKEAKKILYTPPANGEYLLWGLDRSARSLFPSPNGSRVLLQNLGDVIRPWSDNPEEYLRKPYHFYIIDKTGIRFRMTASGNRRTVFTQWLDNRWLVLSSNSTSDNSDYDAQGYLTNKIQMELIDTDTGQLWKVPFPRHYKEDVVSCKLISVKKLVKSTP